MKNQLNGFSTNAIEHKILNTFFYVSQVKKIKKIKKLTLFFKVMFKILN